MTQTPVTASGFPELVCPADQQPLAAKSATLECGKGHRFPVEAGIPRVLLSGTGYVDTFGDQWNTYRLTQLDSYTRTTITRDRLRRCLGETVWAALSAGAPKQVLETGCGAGRFTEVLLDLPSAQVTSTDLSSAVVANVVNCPQNERHRVIQCDIGALPFRPEAYDVVVCLGVVQHTPDTEKTIADLYAQTRPGGWLVIDHYAPELSHYTKITSMLLRPILKALPPRQGTKATELLTRIFFPLHRAVRNHTWAQKVLSRVSPLLTYYHVHPELDDKLQYEWALLDTHDHLTDYYKHLRNVPQIRRALTDLGATDIWVAEGGNGVEARCRKPAR
jgi:2-polyprenyl-3-methyl-5-hydroxy-6-metoxy-1,4-benzoquinol methylase